MHGAVIHQSDVGRTVRERLVIQFQTGNAAANFGMIVNNYLVPGGVVAEYDFKIAP